MAVGASDVGWNTSEKSISHLLNSNRNKRSRWGDESQQMLQLMLGQVSMQQRRQTMDLLGGFSFTRKLSELDREVALPSGWEKCLDLKTGSICFVNRRTGTSTSCDPRMPSIADLNCPPSFSQLTGDDSRIPISLPLFDEAKPDGAYSKRTPEHPSPDLCSLDLGLCLANPFQNLKTAPSCASPSSSPPHSMVSFQTTGDHCNMGDKSVISKSSEAESKGAPAMVTLGCGKCLMYVMLSTADPRCPRCGTSALLDFPQSKKSKFTATV